METVAIVGTGLIGASFGLALRKAGFGGRILGVSSTAALRDALARGAVDEGAPLREAAGAADLIYLAQPIARILDTLAALGPWVRDGALVTDAGSTKSEIVAAALRALRPGQFLGGHPMAGKEKRGAAEADADLFAGRIYAVTPERPEDLDGGAAREFLGWVKRIGAVSVVLAPEEHDRAVAYTSHLPQLLSTALATTLATRFGFDRPHVAGPALDDALRLAASSYDIWGDIVTTNRAAIDAALGDFLAELTNLRASLGSGRTREAFETANRVAGASRPLAVHSVNPPHTADGRESS